MRKFDEKSENSWITIKNLNTQDVVIFLKDQEQIKLFMESSFAEGYVDSSAPGFL